MIELCPKYFWEGKLCHFYRQLFSVVDNLGVCWRMWEVMLPWSVKTKWMKKYTKKQDWSCGSQSRSPPTLCRKRPLPCVLSARSPEKTELILFAFLSLPVRTFLFGQWDGPSLFRVLCPAPNDWLVKTVHRKRVLSPINIDNVLLVETSTSLSLQKKETSTDMYT